MHCLKLTSWPIVPLFNRGIIFHLRKVQCGSPKLAFVNSIHFWNKVVHWNVNILLAAMFMWFQNRLQLWHIKNCIFQPSSKNDVISLAVYLFVCSNQYPSVNSREILKIFSWKRVLRWSHCHQDEGIPWIIEEILKFWLINYLRFLVPPPTVEQFW